MADMNDLMHMLGQIQAGQNSMREEFLEERRSAAESRRILFQKTDELSADVAKLKTDVAITGQEVKALGEKVAQHKAAIDPAVADWVRIKNLGLGFTGIVGLGGAYLLTIAANGWDNLRDAIKSWLG